MSEKIPPKVNPANHPARRSFASSIEHSHFDAWRVFRIMSEFVESFEDMADITAIVAMNKNVLLDKIKEKEKLIKELRSGRDKMLSRIAYLEKQLKTEIKEKIMEEIKS